MNITKELIDTMIKMNPGGCIAYLHTPDGLKLLGISEAIAIGAGYNMEQVRDIVVQDPYALIYEEDLTALKKSIEDCINTSGTLCTAYRIWGKEHKLFWVMSRGKIIGTMDGYPVLFATIQSTAPAESGSNIINKVPSGLGIFKYSDHLKLVFFNDSFYDLVGIERREGSAFGPDTIIQGIHPDDREKVLENLKKAVKNSGYFQMSLRIIKKNPDRYQWIQMDAKVVGQETDGHTLYASFSNIDDIIEMSKQLEDQQQTLEELLQKSIYDSEHDELTGIYNRKKAYAESEKLLAEHPDETFAIVHFDVQRFRLYNSFYGEEEGDKLIIYLANMFRELSHNHKYGVYGRVEADVFFLCFPLTETVLKWNETFIHQKLIEYRSDFMISGSSGVYIARDHHLSVEAMFNRAMEAGKKCADNLLQHVCFYCDEMEQQMIEEQQIATEMRAAVANEEFVVYLQPKYDTRTGKPYGAEALVRWMHPTRGLVPPGKFIPLFEKNGFINTLDKYMWEKVCQLIRKWMDEGLHVTPISVNVSRVSVYSRETVSYLKGLMEKYQIDPGLLNLELTESAYMNDPEAMKNRMRELREFGFQIMMDDFGSGYSSLNTLREMFFDYLKVDRMFLASVTDDPRSRAVLQSVINMAKSIDIPVIAEGVEREQERDLLVNAGCDFIQGFLFAKPMPVEEYECILRENQ